jgi:hypothetical protein
MPFRGAEKAAPKMRLLIACLDGNPAACVEAVMIIVMIRFRPGC